MPILEEPPPRRRLLWVIVALVLLVGAGAGGWLVLGSRPSAETQLRAAEAARARGDPAAEEAALVAALERHPGFAEARWRLARNYLDRGFGAAAERQLRWLRQLGFRDPGFAVAELEALAAQGKHAELIALAGDGTTAEFLRLRADAHLGLRQLDEAAALYRRLHLVVPERPEAPLGLARIAVARGLISTASDLVERALERSHRDPRPWILKGDLGLIEGRPLEAEVAFKTALRHDPGHDAARLGVVRALLAQEKTAAAESELARLARRDAESSTVRYWQAVAAEQRRDLDTAQRLLREVLIRDPRHLEGLLLLGSVHYVKRDFAQAAEVLSRFVKRVPNHRWGVRLLAAALDTLENPQSGDARLPVAGAKYEDPELRALLGDRLASGLEDTLEESPFGIPEGPAAPERAPPAGTAPPPSPALAALVGDGGPRPADAATEAELERAARENPRAVAPRLELARLRLEAGRYPEARAMAEEAARIAPGHPDVLLRLGQVRLASGTGREAVEVLEQLVAGQPRSPEARYQLALARAQAGDPAGAREALKRVLELAPRHLRAGVALGTLLVETREHELAWQLADRLERDHPTSAAGAVLQGDVMLAEGKPDLALSAYERGFARSATSALATKLHLARTRLGDAAGAERGLREWLAAHPDDANARFTLARSAHRAGRGEVAIRDYERVLEHSPNHVLALSNLAWLYQERGDPRGLALAERAYRLAPGSPRVADTYGWLLVQAERAAEAVPILRRAASLAPDVDKHRFHLAAALLAAGDRAGARDILARLRDSTQTFSGRDQVDRMLEAASAGG